MNRGHLWASRYGFALPWPPGAHGWRSYAPIILVALLGLLATWLIFAKVSGLERQRQLDAFSEAARDRLLVIQREVAYALGVVQDVGSFFDASRRVTRRQFRQFVGPALKRNQGIQALQWVARVTAEERDEFLVEARRSFRPFEITERRADGTLKPAAARRVHFPVLYVQPYPENKRLLGLDLGLDPEQYMGLLEAARAGALRVSAPAPVQSATGEQAIFTVYLPVYERAKQEDSEDFDEIAMPSPRQVPSRLRGFALGFFRAGAVVEQALASLGPSGVDMRFYNDASEAPPAPFFVHSSRARKYRLVDQPFGQVGGPEFQGEVLVGDRKWTVICSPVPGFFEPDSWSGYLILGGGFAFTALSSVFLVTSIGRAERVRRLVAQRTDELERSNSALNNEIAERRRAEQALQLLNVTLEHRVARRASEAERRARDLEQFAYVASHDLKAPLRAIANLASWLREDLRDKLTEETREQIDLLRDRVARMNALIEGLLAYSRIGRTAGSVEDVDTAELVAHTIDSIAPPERFKVKVASDMPRLFTDGLHLGQVFANLIGNAISHHDRKKGVVQVSGRDLGEHCEFVVADDGPGIPREYHEKVFMMFQTLQVKDFGVDTGIGLALVKKLVEEHGGAIALDSGQGRGSRFSFTWAKQAPGNDSDEKKELEKG